MKYLKMIGLAALAAVALMAIAGAGPASASVLCKVTATPCPAEDKWKTGTFADGSLKAGSTGQFFATGGEVLGSCSGATISGTVEGSAGSGTETAWAKGSAANVIWSSCSQTMDTISGGIVEIHHIAGTDNGTVTAKEFQTTTSLFGVSCTYGYGAGTDVGVITGGASPSLTVNEVLNKSAGGFLCPSTVIVKGEMVLTEPKEAVYIEDE